MNHAGRTSAMNRSASRPAMATLAICALVSSAMLAGTHAQESRPALSVPVIRAAAPTESTTPQMAQMPNTSETTQPTLPGGKLPQYQLAPHLRKVETNESIEQTGLRFLLALPAEPILVEANVTIDGEAFRKKREQRVRSTLQAALLPPEKREPEIVPLRAQKPAVASEDGEETIAEPITPTVPAFQSAYSNVEKLRRYIASIGREPSLEEARWFFINRLDGPTLLLLKDQFQAFRSDEIPVFHILDRNRDGVISREEIGQAVESFHDCDLNRNEIVDYLEINEAANDPRLRSADLTSTSPLLNLLPTEENAAEVYAGLLSRYGSQQAPATSLPSRFDANSNGRWEPAELESLHTMPADIVLNVRFDSNAPDNSSLSVSEASLKKLAEHQIQAEAVDSTIVLHRPDCELWLSAIQLQAGDQLSLGAVSDGYPMLPVLDPNNDGRFTIRELRGVTQTLQHFDVNGDGQIRKEELRPTIRVSFGLGPGVHQALAGVRRVHPDGAPPKTGPEWFVRMDRNKDNDLTRQEFPGTDEQFQQLDADKDELVSAEEAIEFDQLTSPEPSETTSPPAGETKTGTKLSEETQAD